MSKRKTSTQASPKPPADAPEEETVHDIETTPTTITAKERAYLGRIGRFLVNVQSERYALLKEAEERSDRAKTQTPISPAEIAAAQLARREAYEDLKDWFNDMTALLRGVFNRREELVLGLTRRRGRAGGEEGLEEEEGDDLDQDGPAESEGENAAGTAEAPPAPTKPKGK